jgi:hypothetical protein
VTWRYVDSVAVGSSHRMTALPCQDRCAGAIVATRDGGDALVCVISDGAGSALRAEDGAQLVCDTLLALASAAVRECGDLDELDDERVRGWFLDVRDRLQIVASDAGIDLREFAATSLLAIATARHTLCAQIGDGAIVLRGPEDAAAFEVAVWPAGGEYANQTFFVTDERAQDHLELRRFGGVRDLVALSDGLQSLALEQGTRSAFSPFFEPLVRTVREADGRGPTLRDALAAYLDSDAINQRTDDDKSLAIACRISA